jgi:FkbM family methyltransferase
MSTISKMADLFSILGRGIPLRSFVAARPFSIASLRLHLQIRQICPNLKTIIDAGANVGQFARAATLTFPAAKILSIEPLPAVAAKLRKNLADCDRHVVYEACVGERDGSVKFNENAYSQASSILEICKNSGKGGESVTNRIEVTMVRLDTLLAAEKIERPCLLKLDLQGYELSALKGAVGLLAHIDYLLVETAFREMYSEEPIFRDIEGFLGGYGFKFLRPLAFLQLDSLEIIQMDALFLRGQAM